MWPNSSPDAVSYLSPSFLLSIINPLDSIWTCLSSFCDVVGVFEALAVVLAQPFVNLLSLRENYSKQKQRLKEQKERLNSNADQSCRNSMCTHLEASFVLKTTQMKFAFLLLNLLWINTQKMRLIWRNQFILSWNIAFFWF